MNIPAKGVVYYQVNVTGTHDYQCSYGPFFGSFEELKQMCIVRQMSKRLEIRGCQNVLELSNVMTDCFSRWHIVEQMGK